MSPRAASTETSQPETSSAATETAPPAGERGNGADSGGTAKAGTKPTADVAPKRNKAKNSTARKTRTVELILTVTGTADGEWQVDLKHGADRVVQGLSIPATAVARAAKELHDTVSTTIDEVVDGAREHHRVRLEQLEAEMAKVKQTLAELEG